MTTDIGGPTYQMTGRTIQAQYDAVLQVLEKWYLLHPGAHAVVQLNPAFQAVADLLTRRGIAAETSAKVQPPVMFYVRVKGG